MYKETTYGELMHIASRTNDETSKEFLRKCFQGYCKANNLDPLTATAVTQWQAKKVTLGLGDNMPKILEDRIK